MRVLCLVLVLLGLLFSCKGEPKLDLNNEVTKMNYAIGMAIGKYYKDLQIEWKPEIIAKGFQDAATGASTALTEEDFQQIMRDLNNQMRTKQQEKMQEMGQKNKIEGDAFLAGNKNKEGVQTTASGLQYKVITPGSGKKPAASDKVSVHYRGRLIDGTEFDSSYKRNKPATFGVTQVIPGWQEALQLMNVGAKWELYVPSELAYGPRGSSPNIGPNAVLIFEVELLDIVANDN